MKIVRAARLWFREGKSDKVYEVDLLENDGLAGDARFLVNFRYGRRGTSLREGTKTISPVAREAAEKVFDSVVVAKVNEGYRRTDEPAPATMPATARSAAGDAPPDGRARELLARLGTCLRSPWPMASRERLLWRIGEVRVPAATPDLVALAGKLGGEATYSLVFALARSGGAAAAPALLTLARSASSALVRDLADFALVSPLMGEARAAAMPGGTIPDGIRRAAEAHDADRIVGALTDLAGEAPAQVGPALVALMRSAQQDEPLHAALAAAVRRLPARPPYLIGLRKLYKYAEMADDAAIFAATAHRFETAAAMYRSAQASRGEVWVPELRRRVTLEDERRRASSPVGLSDATLHYFKRRIWRTLRKRGELDDPTYADLAAAYLLTLRPADAGKRTAWTHFAYGSGGQWSREPRAQGPLGRNWTASQLLQRNDPQAQGRYGSLTFIEFPDRPAGTGRAEAFPVLWDARPDLGFRLAADSAIWPVAMLGLRILDANPGHLGGLGAADLGRLLASPHAEVARRGFEEARDRLARGAAEPELLAVLLGADFPEARRLAAERIERDDTLPWTGVELAFAALTTAQADLAEAALRWSGERSLSAGVAEPLARRVADWLLTATVPVISPPHAEVPGEAGPRSTQTGGASFEAPLGGAPQDEDVGGDAKGAAPTDVIRLARTRMRLLWRHRDMPLAPETVRRLLAHPAPAVAAAGIDILGLTGTDPASLPETTWRDLLGSPSEDIQEAALTLFGGLPDAELARHAPLVTAFATSPATALRQAARPLVARLAARDPALADRLGRELIDSLFLTAPDDAYPADIVALLREALPRTLAALDAATVWRLLQARAKGAQLLGAEVLGSRPPQAFSVRQIARLGHHAHLSVREWTMAAFEAHPARFQAEAQDAVLLVETDWPETYAFARRHFDAWPAEAWTPEALAVVTDSVKPEVLDFARHLLRSRLAPADAEAQLTRLLEHPAQSMHLLVTEMLTREAATSEAAFAKLLPLARIVMLQVLRGRVAKDRMVAFLKAEALRDRGRAERVVPLFTDLTLSGTERDRAEAVLALRDIGLAHPGLVGAVAAPVVRAPPSRARGRAA